MNENLASVYEVIADAIPDREVVVQGSRRIIWSELDDRAARLAAHLAAAGIGRDDRVVICLFNSVEYLEATLAVCKLRAVPVNVNYRASARELHYLMENCNAKAVVFHQSTSVAVGGAAAQLPGVTALLAVADDSGVTLPNGSVDYDAALTARAPAERVARDGSDQLIIFTGGTTGMPKAVLWRHRDLLAAQNRNSGFSGPVSEIGDVVRRAVAEGKAPINFVLPPMMHSTGLLGALGSLRSGGTLVLSSSRSLDPDLVWREVSREKVGNLTIVGDVYSRPLVEALQRLNPDEARSLTKSLNIIRSVGVRWSPDSKADLLEFIDATLIDTLASSEGGPVAMARTTRGDKEIKSTFELVNGAWLMDDDGEPVPPGSGKVGMVVSAGILPDGYLGDQSDGKSGTFRVINGKRYAVTGDYGRAEVDGTLTLIGRGSGVINTGGEKVFAEEVEAVLGSYPGVEDVIVAGIPDKRWGHVLSAVVALQEGASVSEADLIAHVGAELAGYKKPRHIRFVDQIQRTTAGKADRQWAAKHLADAILGQPA